MQTAAGFRGDHELAMTLLKEILGSEKGENYLDAQIEASQHFAELGRERSGKIRSSTQRLENRK